MAIPKKVADSLSRKHSASVSGRAKETQASSCKPPARVSSASSKITKKRRPIDKSEEYALQRGLNCKQRLKLNLEHIIAKYDRPFRNETDVIDMKTLTVIKSNGHLERMKDRTPQDFGKSLRYPEPLDPSLCMPREEEDYKGDDEPFEADDLDWGDDGEDEEDLDEVEDEGDEDDFGTEDGDEDIGNSGDPKLLTDDEDDVNEANERPPEVEFEDEPQNYDWGIHAVLREKHAKVVKELMMNGDESEDKGASLKDFLSDSFWQGDHLRDQLLQTPPKKERPMRPAAPSVGSLFSTPKTTPTTRRRQQEDSMDRLGRILDQDVIINSAKKVCRRESRLQ